MVRNKRNLGLRGDRPPSTESPALANYLLGTQLWNVLPAVDAQLPGWITGTNVLLLERGYDFRSTPVSIVFVDLAICASDT